MELQVARRSCIFPVDASLSMASRLGNESIERECSASYIFHDQSFATEQSEIRCR